MNFFFETQFVKPFNDLWNRFRYLSTSSPIASNISRNSFFNIFFLFTFVIVFSSVQAKQYPVAIFTKIIKTDSPIVGISKLQNLNVEYPTYCTQRFCYNFILLLLCKWLCPTKTLESGNRTIPQENLNIQRS